MADVSYISWTGIKTYLTCPQQYFQKYILKVPEVDADQSSFCKGNALHNLMEWWIKEGNPDPNPIIEQAPLFWSNELSKIERNPRHTLSWTATEKEKHRKLYVEWAYSLAKLFKDYDLHPERMQSEFKADSYVTLGNHRVKLGGRVDILLKGKKGGWSILDLKSTVHKASCDPRQLTHYALVTDVFLEGQLDAPVGHGGFLLPGFPEGKRLPLYTITEQDKEAYKRMVVGVLDGIKADQFAPTENRHCWSCNFRSVCPLFGGALPKQAGVHNLLGP